MAFIEVVFLIKLINLCSLSERKQSIDTDIIHVIECSRFKLEWYIPILYPKVITFSF